MGQVAGGVLEEPRDGHDLGVPYVTVIARTLDAAEVAESNLESLARIDKSQWQRGWREIVGSRLAIDIYPVAPESFVGATTTATSSSGSTRNA